MAKVTSSATRSKRAAQSKAVVRSSKGRANRQAASTAQVTDSSNRPSNGGARVTEGRGAYPKPRPALPGRGGTSANSPKAVGQRTVTAVRQRAAQDVSILRGLADNMRRNQERDARAEGVRSSLRMTSGNTRYVPPGGENASQRALPPSNQRALPPGQPGGSVTRAQPSTPATAQRASGGAPRAPKAAPRGPRPGGYTVVDETPRLKPATQGGTIQRSPEGEARVQGNGGPIQRVSVREIPSRPSLPGGSQPKVQGGSSQPKVGGGGLMGTLRGALRDATVGQRVPGSPRPSSQTKSLPGGQSERPKGGIGAGLLNAAGFAAGGFLADKVGKAAGTALANNVLRPLGQAMDRMPRGADGSPKGTKAQPRRGLPDNYRQTEAATGLRAPSAQRPPAAPQRPSSAPSVPSTAQVSGGAPRAVTSAAPRASKPTVSGDAMAQWRAANSDLAAQLDYRNATRGTSMTDNPLLKDSAARMPKPNIGPTQGESYGNVLKIMEERKKKKS